MPLTDSARLLAYKDALGNWAYEGYVQFTLQETAYRWIQRELGPISLKEIGCLMYEFVAAGGEIDEVPETRGEWSDQFEFHYDLRFLIQGKPVYIETRLHFRPPFVADQAWIEVVNVHAP